MAPVPGPATRLISGAKSSTWDMGVAPAPSLVRPSEEKQDAVGGTFDRVGVEGGDQWWSNRAMERPLGHLASGDHWATPAVGPGGGTAPLSDHWSQEIG